MFFLEDRVEQSLCIALWGLRRRNSTATSAWLFILRVGFRPCAAADAEGMVIVLDVGRSGVMTSKRGVCRFLTLTRRLDLIYLRIP